MPATTHAIGGGAPVTRLPELARQLPNLKRVRRYMAPIHPYADALQGVALEVFTLQIPLRTRDPGLAEER